MVGTAPAPSNLHPAVLRALRKPARARRTRSAHFRVLEQVRTLHGTSTFLDLGKSYPVVRVGRLTSDRRQHCLCSSVIDTTAAICATLAVVHPQIASYIYTKGCRAVLLPHHTSPVHHSVETNDQEPNRHRRLAPHGCVGRHPFHGQWHASHARHHHAGPITLHPLFSHLDLGTMESAATSLPDWQDDITSRFESAYKGIALLMPNVSQVVEY